MYLITPPPPGENDLYRRKRAALVVLGDLNRSPRMNYHAKSLAQLDYEVELCGYNSKQEEFEFKSPHELITLRSIPEIKNRYNLPFFIFGIGKVILQHYYLYQMLRELKSLGAVDLLLIQNPPSIPILGIARFFVLFMSPNTKLIIDWHNLGYSILALKLGPKHPMVLIYRFYEKWLGRRAFAHFTVTTTMAEQLRKQFGMDGRRIIPLHDRPGDQFQVIKSSEQKQEIINYLQTEYGIQKFGNEKIIITATSYTPDEDLYMLLKALRKYDKEKNGPKLRVIITGKGPMYDEISKAIIENNKELSHVTVTQLWLSNEDYPKALGIADLGISLHTSSSGWDLPMKVVDMFGCGVPVIAINFEALHELVKDLHNGISIPPGDYEALSSTLQDILNNTKNMQQIKNGAIEESKIRWGDNWTSKVGPLFMNNNTEKDRHDSSSSDEEESS